MIFHIQLLIPTKIKNNLKVTECFLNNKVIIKKNNYFKI